MKRMKSDVPIVMLSGLSHIPECQRACMDVFIVKGEHPSAVLP